MKNVLLVFLGFVIGTVMVFIFITYDVQNQLGKNEPVKVETKTEVKYVLGEKKECEDKGGKFYIISNILLLTANKEYDYWLSCDKHYKEGNKSITETIFDYKI